MSVLSKDRVPHCLYEGTSVHLSGIIITQNIWGDPWENTPLQHRDIDNTYITIIYIQNPKEDAKTKF